MTRKFNPSIVSAVLASLGFVASVLLFLPGGMTNDSVVQYAQVQGLIPLDTWHPVIFVKIWRWLDQVYQGPMLMLVLQQLLYWSGLFLVGRNLFSKTHLMAFVVLLGLFPVFHTLMGTVWKDGLLFGSCLFALGLLLEGSSKKAPLFLVFSLLVFSIVCAVRHNGILAVVPLLLLLFRRPVSWSKLVTGTSMLVFVVGLSSIYNYSRTAKQHSNLINQVWIWDLWGMSLELGKPLIPPSSFRSGQKSLDHYTRFYSKNSNNPVIFNPTADINREIFDDSKAARELRAKFFEVLMNEPAAYLSVRLRYFISLIGHNNWHPYMAYHLDIVEP